MALDLLPSSPGDMRTPAEVLMQHLGTSPPGTQAADITKLEVGIQNLQCALAHVEGAPDAELLRGSIQRQTAELTALKKKAPSPELERSALEGCQSCLHAANAGQTTDETARRLEPQRRRSAKQSGAY